MTRITIDQITITDNALKNDGLEPDSAGLGNRKVKRKSHA